MSSSVLEQLRSAHEDIENIEKAMSMVLMDKHKNSKAAVTCEHALKYLVESTQLKCKTAIDIYQDKDGMRTDDINALAGQRADKKGGDVWTSFYDKVKEVKDYHRRFSVNQGLPELQNSEWFYQRALESDKTDSLFSGEEDYGKRVDMHELFVTYLNLKKISTLRRSNFRQATFARLKKKTVDLEPDDPEVDKTVEKEFHELDYIEWLKTFDQFHEINRYCKYREKNYTEYLEGLISYLRGFLLRTQPLIDADKLEQQFEKEFEERWNDKSIPGWQEPTHKDKMFCLPSNKLFNNSSSKKSHESGKVYKKKLEEVQKLGLEDQKKLAEMVEDEDRRIACLESRAAKWHDLLSDAINETIQHLQKKQSQTVEEMEAEKEDSEDEDMEDDGADMGSNDGDDEERPIYNPLNLPLGWDGKPIPFWLYKLHGMGIEYKCEICGNYSYWGRRAFERHFQEWRHAFGMRCLKIPSYPSASCVMSSASAEGVALAPAFVGPVVRAPAPVARPQQGTRPSQDSAGAASTLQTFMLGTAGAAACRRAARGVSTAARKVVPRAKIGQRLQGRSVTSLQAEAQPQRVAMQATAVAEAPTKTYEVGEKLHGWTCARVEYVKEFGCTGYLFQHDKTGAELLSMVQPADENKTFSVVFRTPPENSNGIAHVLEHSVLCGSRKYPVKEPFVELMKSSLQTFLNAMTFPDRTCYPVASCNLKDFYNLIDVYMDAVFFPRAVNDPLVLAQEGWHYEIEKKDDPLTFKGVVFNEMKGLYSNPDALHGRTANQSMFPDNQYGVDSGGDPKDIPSLTFDYFKDFHSKYYHPSNAKFWFYGDDPADARLELVDQYLSQFEKIEVDSQITVQPKLTEPRRIVEDFAAGEDEDISKKIMMSINWVISEGKEDLQTSLALQFLNYLMMGTPASPLYKALVDSGLGSRVIGGGLDDGMLQATFSVGLKDLKEEDVPKVEELIMKTLEELAEKGFESDDIKAAVNTIEFQNRELNTGSFPKGLALLFAANSNWNYDKDPFEALKFEAPLEELKARLEKGEPVFQDLIKTKILDNSHKVILESRPNKQLGKKMEEEEKATLQKHRETLSEKDIEDLINETVKLKEIQETPDTPEAMKTVPGLELSDIPKETPKVPTELVSGEPTVLRHALPTSGVIYTDVAFDLSRVPEELIPLVPLFTRALKQLGTAKGDFVSLTRRVGMSTGGISASTICMNKKGDSEPVAYLFMRGKAMAPQISELSDLMQEIALTTDFDNKDRIVQLASQARSGAQSSLVSSGHMVANASLAAQTTKAGWLSGQFSGVEQYKFLSELLKRIEDGGWEGVLQQLKALQACIFNKASCTILNITSDAEHLDPAQASLEKLASNLPVDESSGPVLLDPTLGRRADGIVVPTQVNYVGKGGNLYESGYEYHGSALVVSKLLGATYLWDKVRVVGGAYGGFCRFDPRSGDFKYLSYRDPNLGQTLETYDGAPGFLKDLELGEDELTKAVIGCMGDVDAYLLPDAKGYQAMLRHLLGEDDEYRQKVRDQILGTKVEDFHKFGEALEPVIEKGGICVVGSAESCDKAKEKYGLSLTSPFAEE